MGGYQLLYVGRSIQKKKGLGVLIKSCILAHVRLDFLPLNIEIIFESCVVECFFPNNEKILITVIYHTLSASQVQFRNCFENLLDKLTSLNTYYLVIEDIILI